jgi:hypothetical protein
MRIRKPACFVSAFARQQKCGDFGTKMAFLFLNREAENVGQRSRKAIAVLNLILEAELASVVRYPDHSLLVSGFGRITIVACLR